MYLSEYAHVNAVLASIRQHKNRWTAERRPMIGRQEKFLVNESYIRKWPGKMRQTGHEAGTKHFALLNKVSDMCHSF